MDETLKVGSLRRLWPLFSRVAGGLFLLGAFTLVCGGWTGLIARPTQHGCMIVLLAFGVLLATVEDLLKRFGYIEKEAKSSYLNEDGPRQPEPPPVAEPAEIDPYAEPERAAGEETLTPLGGGALPSRFDRQGRKAVWRISND